MLWAAKRSSSGRRFVESSSPEDTTVQHADCVQEAHRRLPSFKLILCGRGAVGSKTGDSWTSAEAPLLRGWSRLSVSREGEPVKRF